MAHRTFNVTIPSDTAYHQLYALILLTTGSIPINGILPDRVQEFEMIPAPTNTLAVNVSDANYINNAGFVLTGMTKRSTRNTICLKDYYISGNAQGVIVDLEFV